MWRINVFNTYISTNDDIFNISTHLYCRLYRDDAYWHFRCLLMLTNASTETTAAGTALRAKALILLITSYIVGPLDACTSTVPVTRELRRVRCDLRPREHVTNRFTWLPIAARIEFKICVLAYKSLNSTAPACISDRLQPVSTLQRQTNLRSATNSELFVPHTRLRVGERGFKELSVQQLLVDGMLCLQTSSELPLY